jgi:MFS family permease
VRRGIAAATAVVLVLEALTIAFVNWILGLVVRHQEMSLAGLRPSAMAAGSWVAGGIFALFLIGCAVLVARIALRDRMPGRFGRIVLIVCAVVNGVLGAAVVGLVGWYAFALAMVVLALLVGTLLLYAPEDRSPASAGPPAKPEPPREAPPAVPPATA